MPTQATLEDLLKLQEESRLAEQQGQQARYLTPATYSRMVRSKGQSLYGPEDFRAGWQGAQPANQPLYKSNTLVNAISEAYRQRMDEGRSQREYQAGAETFGGTGLEGTLQRAYAGQGDVRGAAVTEQARQDREASARTAATLSQQMGLSAYPQIRMSQELKASQIKLNPETGQYYYAPEYTTKDTGLPPPSDFAEPGMGQVLQQYQTREQAAQLRREAIEAQNQRATQGNITKKDIATENIEAKAKAAAERLKNPWIKWTPKMKADQWNDMAQLDDTGLEREATALLKAQPEAVEELYAHFVGKEEILDRAQIAASGKKIQQTGTSTFSNQASDILKQYSPQ